MHDKPITGNPAALREALVGLFDAYANRKCPASVCDKCNVECRVNDAWTAAQDALSVPSRNCDRLPRCGIIIEATPDELAALPFNPVYAEVEIRPARGGGGNQRREGAGA